LPRNVRVGCGTGRCCSLGGQRQVAILGDSHNKALGGSYSSYDSPLRRLSPYPFFPLPPGVGTSLQRIHPGWERAVDAEERFVRSAKRNFPRDSVLAHCLSITPPGVDCL
jgi:hypothetical protein